MIDLNMAYWDRFNMIGMICGMLLGYPSMTEECSMRHVVWSNGYYTMGGYVVRADRQHVMSMWGGVGGSYSMTGWHMVTDLTRRLCSMDDPTDGRCSVHSRWEASSWNASLALSFSCFLSVSPPSPFPLSSPFLSLSLSALLSQLGSSLRLPPVSFSCSGYSDRAGRLISTDSSCKVVVCRDMGWVPAGGTRSDGVEFLWYWAHGATGILWPRLWV